jgi:hypothetical protein
MLTQERKATSLSLNPASIPNAQSDSVTSAAADCHFNKKATSSTSINILLRLCPIKNFSLPVSNYASRRHPSCASSAALDRRHRHHCDAYLSPGAAFFAGRSTIKRAAHMIRTAAVSMCAVNDGRTGPSTRYIRDACRGVSLSTRTGFSVSTIAGAMSSAGTRREGVSHVSASTSDWTTRTRSCVGVSASASAGAVSASTCVGISVSASAGAVSLAGTGREGVSCISTSGNNWMTRSCAGVSASACAGAVSASARAGISVSTSPCDMCSTGTRREGVSCISASASNGTTRSSARVSISTCTGAISSAGEGVSCISASMSNGTTRSHAGISARLGVYRSAHTSDEMTSSAGTRSEQVTSCASISKHVCVSGIGAHGTRDVSQQDPACVQTLPLDECTPGFSPGCFSPMHHKHQSASTSSLNRASSDFDSPFNPRRLLEQLDLGEFGEERNQSVAGSDSPSPSAIVHMICNHPSCKEVIQSLMSDKLCLSHAQDHFAMNLPIAVWASYNHVNIDWSKCIKLYPVNEHAFRVYSCGSRIGTPRSDKSGSIAEQKAKKYAKQ